MADPCSGTPDGEYTFGTCKGGVLVATGSGLVGGNADWYLQINNRIPTDGYVSFYPCVPPEGGYFYVRTPSGKIINKVSVPANSCPQYRIYASSLNETGNYLGVVTDLSGNIKKSQTINLYGGLAASDVRIKLAEIAPLALQYNSEAELNDFYSTVLDLVQKTGTGLEAAVIEVLSHGKLITARPGGTVTPSTPATPPVSSPPPPEEGPSEDEITTGIIIALVVLISIFIFLRK